MGEKDIKKISRIEIGESVLLVVGTARTLSVVAGSKNKKRYEISLKIPICAEIGTRMAISRQIKHRYRLIGWGVLKDGT
ncbi:MAG: hypothetical protein ACFFCZ_19015 [Promethearchaeota archaeon]